MAFHLSIYGLPILQAKFWCYSDATASVYPASSLDSIAIRAMMDSAHKVQIALAALPCCRSARSLWISLNLLRRPDLFAINRFASQLPLTFPAKLNL